MRCAAAAGDCIVPARPGAAVRGTLVHRALSDGGAAEATPNSPMQRQATSTTTSRPREGHGHMVITGRHRGS